MHRNYSQQVNAIAELNTPTLAVVEYRHVFLCKCLALFIVLSLSKAGGISWPGALKAKDKWLPFPPLKDPQIFFFFFTFFSFCIEIRNGCRSVRVIAPWCISPKFLLVWSLFPPSIVYFPCTTKSHWGFHCWKSGTMFPSWVFPSSLFPQLHMNPEQWASRCSPS